jgi:hypothetical protein
MNRATNSWKPNRIIVFFSILLSIVIIDACRKIEIQDKKAYKAPDASRFFGQHVPTDARTKAALDFINRQNVVKNFVNGTINKIGYPYWDKAIVATSANTSRGATEDSATAVFVPFVEDEENVVNASMQVMMNGTDTSWSYVCDWQYRDTVNGMTGKQQSLLLMSLDKNVFGERMYRIVDSNAFGGGVSHVKINTATTTGRGINTGRGTDYYAYVTVTICSWQWVPLYEGQVVGCEPGPECPFYNYEEVCNDLLAWQLFEGGGSSGSTGTGNSGGNNGEPQECVPNQVKGMNALECQPGWIPGPASSGSGLIGAYNFNVWSVTGDDQLKINYWKTNNIDTTGLDSCMRKILEKIIFNSSDNWMGKILTKMDKSIFEPNNITKFKLKFETASLDTGTAAQIDSIASYNEATGMFSIKIFLNTYYLSRSTELNWISTITHEILHAYFRATFRRYFTTFNQAQLDSSRIEDLFDPFIDSMMSRNSQEGLENLFSGDPQYDHNFMTKYLINSLADAIEQADGSSIANKRYYWFMAWGGLQETKTWRQHWSTDTWPPTNPAPSEDSLRGLKYALTLNRLDTITKALFNEQFGTPNAKGKQKIPGACY